MAKRVIILGAGRGAVVAAFWLEVPLAQQAFYADPTATSGWAGATSAEVNAIKAGVIFERVERLEFSPDTAISQVRLVLEAHWTARQNALNADNPLAAQGRYWDAAGWHAAGA